MDRAKRVEQDKKNWKNLATEREKRKAIYDTERAQDSMRLKNE